jgi:hypothetical protein
MPDRKATLPLFSRLPLYYSVNIRQLGTNKLFSLNTSVFYEIALITKTVSASETSNINGG